MDIQTIEEHKALNDELKILGLSIENLAELDRRIFILFCHKKRSAHLKVIFLPGMALCADTDVDNESGRESLLVTEAIHFLAPREK